VKKKVAEPKKSILGKFGKGKCERFGLLRRHGLGERRGHPNIKTRSGLKKGNEVQRNKEKGAQLWVATGERG